CRRIQAIQTDERRRVILAGQQLENIFVNTCGVIHSQAQSSASDVQGLGADSQAKNSGAISFGSAPGSVKSITSNSPERNSPALTSYLGSPRGECAVPMKQWKPTKTKSSRKRADAGSH